MAQTLNTQQTMRAFGVSDMTLWNWRKGTPTKTALPAVVTGEGRGARVAYRPASLQAWAKKNGVEFAVPLDKVLKEAAKQPAPKPGPKPKKSAKPTASARTAQKATKRARTTDAMPKPLRELYGAAERVLKAIDKAAPAGKSRASSASSNHPQ